MSSPAIVVVAWNRPQSLQRLLAALAMADYPVADIPLVLALDGEAHPEVVQLADSFAWPHGHKEIIQQPKRLGLKAHILRCGDLSQQFGSIILLEDDLLVSRWFYRFAVQALAVYTSQDQITGISLYSHRMMESNGFYPFFPSVPETGVYFMRYAVSWGQAWTAGQWQQFRDWYQAHPNADNGTASYLDRWPDDSWKKHFVRYLMHTDRYFVCPGSAYSTNFGDAGVHFPEDSAVFQVPLATELKQSAWSPYLPGSVAYDACFEPEVAWLKEMVPTLAEFDLEVDLHGQKDLGKSSAEWVLTCRPVRNARMTWGMRMKPLWQNLHFGVEGDALHLARREDVLALSEKDRLDMYIRLHRFYYPVPKLRSQVFYEFLKGLGAMKK